MDNIKTESGVVAFPVKSKPRMRFGATLRAYRQKAGLEQEEVGRTLGVSKHTVSNWERDIARPDVSYIPILSQVLHMPLHAFFEMPDPNMCTSEEKQLLDDYRSLTIASKRHVRRIMDSVLFMEEEAQNERLLRMYRALPEHDNRLAAGFDFPLEADPGTHNVFVRNGGIADRATDIFWVNGESMQPMYPDGSRVFVERADATSIAYGEPIACIVDNVPYVKIYEKDGLHSVNPAFSTIRVNEQNNVCLIGRVLGLVRDNDLASVEDSCKLEALIEE